MPTSKLTTQFQTSLQARILVGLATLISIALGSNTSNAQTEQQAGFRVLCYNIHYGQGTDGRYDLERLAAVIRKVQPDIVALQEVDVVVRRSGKVHQLQELARLTGLSARFGPTQHYEGGLFGNAVLTSFPIEDVVIQPLPYSESTADRTTYPRAAIAVVLRLPDGLRLRFISTHFQHNVAADRVAEATAINRLFAHKKDQIPTVLAGDFNAKPDEEPIRILLQEWKHTMDAAAPPTAPATQPRSRIDYVFHRSFDRLKVKSSRVIAESVASDHRPVLVDFVWDTSTATRR